MPRPMKNLTGQRFGRLLVVEPLGPRSSKIYWSCQCDCGATCAVVGANLRCGKTQSCGCLRHAGNQATHGHTRRGKSSPTWRSWHSMIDRCTNPNNPDYRLYGGAGRTVCTRWLYSFEHFLADMGERKPGTTIDRHPDRVGNYEPGNCRWATSDEQARNKTTTKVTVAMRDEIVRRVKEHERAADVARALGIDPRLAHKVMASARRRQGGLS